MYSILKRPLLQPIIPQTIIKVVEPLLANNINESDMVMALKIIMLKDTSEVLNTKYQQNVNNDFPEARSRFSQSLDSRRDCKLHLLHLVSRDRVENLFHQISDFETGRDFEHYIL